MKTIIAFLCSQLIISQILVICSTAADIAAKSGSCSMTNDEGLQIQVWKKDTNDIASQLTVAIPYEHDAYFWIAVYSKRTNSPGHTYVSLENGKLARCELLDSFGKSVPTISDSKIQTNQMAQIPSEQWPKWRNGIFKNLIGFGPEVTPQIIYREDLRKIFNMNGIGSYTLIVDPVIYELTPDGRNFQRIVLPSLKSTFQLEVGKTKTNGL